MCISLRTFLPAASFFSSRNGREVINLLKEYKRRGTLKSSQMVSAVHVSNRLEDGDLVRRYVRKELGSNWVGDFRVNEVLQLLSGFARGSRVEGNKTEGVLELYVQVVTLIRRVGLLEAQVRNILNLVRTERLLNRYDLAPAIIEHLSSKRRIVTEEATAATLLIYVSSLKKFCSGELFVKIASLFKTNYWLWSKIHLCELLSSAGRANVTSFPLIAKLTPIAKSGFLNTHTELSIKPLLEGYTSAVTAAHFNLSYPGARTILELGASVMTDLSKYIAITKLSTFNEKSISVVLKAVATLRGTKHDLQIISSHEAVREHELLNAAHKLGCATSDFVTNRTNTATIEDDVKEILRKLSKGDFKNTNEEFLKNVRKKVIESSLQGYQLATALKLFPDLHDKVVPLGISFKYASSIARSLSRAGIRKSRFYELSVKPPKPDQFLVKNCCNVIIALGRIHATNAPLMKYTLKLLSVHSTTFSASDCAALITTMAKSQVKAPCDPLLNSIKLKSFQDEFPIARDCPQLLDYFSKAKITPGDILVTHYCNTVQPSKLDTPSLINYCKSLTRTAIVSYYTPGNVRNLIFRVLENCEKILVFRDWDPGIGISPLLKLLDEVSYPGHHGLVFRAIRHFSDYGVLSQCHPGQVLAMLHVLDNGKHRLPVAKRLFEGIVLFAKNNINTHYNLPGQRTTRDALLQHPLLAHRI
eukprot:TRINITY_DN16705_c0_g1_i1.p1 TRINITY_DN16705_c0_g1~~TRINITY_DN16705_c0_g1_i1.p1  ORF type:complete len:701 (+),score=81.75 TRINITY_DN16705_c0_g1_i1:97-2199(+)